MEIKSTQFAMNCGNPLIKSIDHVVFPKQHQLDPVYFFKGDISAFKLEGVRMPDQGYQILKDQIGPHQSSYDSQFAQSIIAEQYLGSSNHADQVYLMNGGCMALFNIFEAFIDHHSSKQQVILQPELTFPFFNGLQAPATNIKCIDYRLDETNNFDIDLVDLENKIKEIIENPEQQLKFIWIINPSNPQSTVFKETHLEEFIKIVQKYKQNDQLIPIVSDEIYWNMNYLDSIPFVSMAKIAQKYDHPLCIMTGFDKNLMVPGWNISWIMFNDPAGQLKQHKSKVQQIQQIFKPPSIMFQIAAGQILQKIGNRYVQNNVLSKFQDNVKKITELFDKDELLKEYFWIQQPQGVIYLLLVIKDISKFEGIKNDLELLNKMIEQQNIGCFSCIGFQQDQKDRIKGLRLVVCSEFEQYRLFFERLRQFVTDNSK